MGDIERKICIIYQGGDDGYYKYSDLNDKTRLDNLIRAIETKDDYNFYLNGLIQPTCLKIIYIRVCVCNTCGFHI